MSYSKSNKKAICLQKLQKLIRPNKNKKHAHNNLIRPASPRSFFCHSPHSASIICNFHSQNTPSSFSQDLYASFLSAQIPFHAFPSLSFLQLKRYLLRKDFPESLKLDSSLSFCIIAHQALIRVCNHFSYILFPPLECKLSYRKDSNSHVYLLPPESTSPYFRHGVDARALFVKRIQIYKRFF